MRMAPSRRAYRLMGTLSRLLATARKLNPNRNKAMARRAMLRHSFGNGDLHDKFV
ncbi:hypothetical protein ABIG06_003523 [Bradyrhizobium sp. USDA 326]|uniref:Uncharacterized protein n=1 Tax=Bradyrhizobium yuanmingense TaxID=108015 RepID=A0A1C3XLE0_9BRAD|nr:hypothetical protein IQ15_07627 [Bradyrhizobium yuanmingense]SCB53073.1 hypothetical protein GA0061099_10487 [Bradyrhizobium yuanmingense]